MFTRLLKLPKNSVFLFGPRGTGKSTWIKQNFKNCIYYDLLDHSDWLRFSKDPSSFYKECISLASGTWVVIDEIQKVPSLLNLVHRLIEEKKLKFVLSGSSARKLKKEGANLLAGRARSLEMFPLISAEVDYQFTYPEIAEHGTLPIVYTEKDPKEYLRSYVNTYLQEEIKAEALTRNLGSFSRFLEIAARQNGQLTNMASISRDAQVARQTVQGFFEILQDTLLGNFLNPWKLKSTNKQVAHSKFYFFDSGVARALSGRLAYPANSEELGFLFETFIFSELRAFMSYRQMHYPLWFWSSTQGVEVDFFWEDSEGYVALEIKSAERWTRQYNLGFMRLQEEFGKKVRCYGVYTGQRKTQEGAYTVYPYLEFLKLLWEGKITR